MATAGCSVRRPTTPRPFPDSGDSTRRALARAPAHSWVAPRPRCSRSPPRSPPQCKTRGARAPPRRVG
eukprot:11050007-Lingulodinium_polyedra.AAC.1